VRTEIVTITVMMIEWVTMEELMIAAAIAVTTCGAPGPRPPALGVETRPPGIGNREISAGRVGEAPVRRLTGTGGLDLVRVNGKCPFRARG
jgi:hypothetical protein